VSETTSIEWTDASWTPIRARGELGKWFCQRISPGCDHCYAATFNRRQQGQFYGPVNPALAHQLVRSGQIYLDQDALLKPLGWRKPKMVFLSSMTDIFGEWVPTEWLDQIWSVLALTPQHIYQVLTKRPTRMGEYLGLATPDDALCRVLAPLELEHPFWQAYEALRRRPDWLTTLQGPLPNVWLGASIEDDRYTWRARELANIPAAVRFISAEPLLGPLPSLVLDDLHWIITGGESGPGARPMHPDWCRELRDRCLASSTSVAYFHKQWGEWLPDSQTTGEQQLDLAMVNAFGGNSPRRHHWPDGSFSRRIGKKKAGRQLDGRTWDFFPGVRNGDSGRAREERAGPGLSAVVDRG
jgi:protein gp37